MIDRDYNALCPVDQLMSDLLDQLLTDHQRARLKAIKAQRELESTLKDLGAPL